MNNALIDKFKDSVQAMHKDLMIVRRKYFEQKRREKLGELASATEALNSMNEM
jgi:hypothetical protein